MHDEIRSLSDREVDAVTGGYKDGTSNTLAIILPHVEQDNAVVSVQASVAVGSK